MNPIRKRIPAIVLLITCAVKLGAAQSSEPQIVVNGVVLTVPRPPFRLGNDWFVPLQPITEALGFRIVVVANVNELRVRRGTGAEAIYDGSTGEVRYGPVVVGQIRNYKQVSTSGPANQWMFPLDGLVVLLAVDVHVNPDDNLITIDAGDGSRMKLPSGPGFGLADANYMFGMTTTGSSTGHYTVLRSDAMAGGVSLSSNILASGVDSSIGFRQGFVQGNFGRHRLLTAGDQAAYTGIDSFAASVRGVGYKTPFRGIDLQSYGGRAAGSTHAELGGPSVAQFDTTIEGFALRKRTRVRDVSFAADTFHGPQRSGTKAGLSFSQTIARNQFRVQFVAGKFHGESLRIVLPVQAVNGPVDPVVFSGPPETDEAFVSRAQVRGMATGINISDTYIPFAALTISTQIERYGRNFLTPSESSQFNAQTTKRLSATYRPLSQVSLFGGANTRDYVLGIPGALHGFNYGASGSLPHMRPLQLTYLRSTQTDSGAGSTFQMTQYSAVVGGLDRFNGNVTYSDFRFNSRASKSLSISIGRDYGRLGNIAVHDQQQVKNNNRFGADWQIDLPGTAGNLRVGVDRLSSFQDPQQRYSSYVPVIGVKLKVPGGQNAQLTFSGERKARIFSLTFGGPLMKRESIREDHNGRVTVLPTSTLSGRVYFDADDNHSFTGADRAMADIAVWLDETISVKTDAKGEFRFDGVKSGAHVVRTDLEGIPADMAFGQSSVRTVAVLPYRPNTQEFTVVRMGAVSGKVMYLDYSDPDNPIERPLADVRIVADAEHDTYSDINGNIQLGSLPPGKYQLIIDREFMPEGYAPSVPVMNVTVQAGETVRNIRFLLVIPPKPVIQKAAPDRPIAIGGAGGK